MKAEAYAVIGSVLGLALALQVGLPAAALSASAPLPLEPLTFLLGTWGASGGGKPGEATGSATFETNLQGRIIIRTSYAAYPASDSTPASRHDDLMVIYTAEATGMRADYYDNEGHVIHYLVRVVAPGEAIFVSEVVPGAPRYRLTYKLRTDGVLAGTFEVAPPGRPDAFAQYLVWESLKVKAGG
jgi:hypothetical protein